MNFGNPNQAKPDTNYMNAGKNYSNQYKNNFNRYSNSCLLPSTINERQASNLNEGMLNNANYRLYSSNFNQSSLPQASNNHEYYKNEEEEIRYLGKANRNEQQNWIPNQPQNFRNSHKSDSGFINATINLRGNDQNSINPIQDQPKPIEQQRQRFLNSFNNNSVQRPFFNFVPNKSSNLQRQPFENIYSNSNIIQQPNPIINRTQNFASNDSQKQPILISGYSSNVQQPLINLKQKHHLKPKKNDDEDSEFVIELSNENSEKEDQGQKNSEQRLTEEQFNADSSEQEEEEKTANDHSNDDDDDLANKQQIKRKRRRKKMTVIKRRRRRNYFDDESIESDTEHSSTSDFFYDASDTLQSKLIRYQQYCSQQSQPNNFSENHSQKEDESTHFIKNSEEEEEEIKYSGDYDGILVYIYTGQHNTNENFTFRQLCKHYGLTAWDELNSYLPWRSRSDLRLTLMKMIKKQAISEYSGIRADPTKIGADNTDLNDENYKLKGGLWVNKKWDKSPEEKREIKLKNKDKYHIDIIEALDVDVPLILSHDYLIERVQGRKANLILFNAALSNEYLKRTGEKLPCAAGLSQLKVMTNKVCKVHKPKIVLKASNDISKYVFDVPEFKDK